MKLQRVFAKDGTGTDHIAEDIAQDTIVAVLDSVGLFRGESRFTTWVAKIAVNLANTELRRRQWSKVSLEVLPAESISLSSHASK